MTKTHLLPGAVTRAMADEKNALITRHCEYRNNSNSNSSNKPTLGTKTRAMAADENSLITSYRKSETRAMSDHEIPLITRKKGA